MQVICKFDQTVGRHGDLEGVFVAEKEDIEKSYGKTVCYYDVLGKHSEVEVDLSENNLKIIEADQDFIDKLVKIFGCTDLSGINPLHSIEEDEEDEEDD